MKKTKFLALSLVVALGLTGTAFAYWGQDIASNTTVNTGKLEVAIIDKCHAEAVAIASDDSSVGGTTFWGHDDKSWVIDDTSSNDVNYDAVRRVIGDQHRDTTVSADGKTVTAVLGNMYPGAKVKIYYTAKNTGSIPVKVADVTPAFPAGIGDFFNAGIKGPGFDTGIVDQTALSSTLKTKLNTSANYIEPGNTAEFVVTLDFAKNLASIGPEQYEMLNANNIFTIKTNFTQFNAK